jgi:hypothetical protein
MRLRWLVARVGRNDPARTAKLGVVRKNGAPHVAPVWIALGGDDVIFMTGADKIKGKAILRDPREVGATEKQGGLRWRNRRG